MDFRYDIQALRGYAVFIILLYHAQIGPFTGGYLGVDIFFVISGFLITGIIKRAVEDRRFSFRQFYYRRAKRLLPAAYVVLLLTIIGAHFFLTSVEYNNFKNQILGALTFSINFTLRDQADYFAGSAELKPLLHMWSLAIEEQFYLLLPLLMVFIPLKRWGIIVITLLFLSIVACFLLVETYQRDVFYFLPTRAWELAIGGLGALYAHKIAAPRKLRAALSLFALLVLIGLPIAPISHLHPHIDALLVNMATISIILFSPSPAASNLLIKIPAKMGDYSYSIYLVHWPIFAFAHNAYMDDTIPLSVRGGLLLLSCIIAIAIYHLVEYPVHKATYKHPKRFVAILVLCAIALLGLMMVFKHGYDKTDYKERLRANTGLAGSCDQRGEGYTLLPECQTSDNPNIMIWGDSLAMHLVKGLQEQLTGNQGIIQATRSSCAPFQGISYYNYPKYTKEWAKECINFNEQVLDALNTMPNITHVILSSPFSSVVSAGNPGLKLDKENIGYNDINMGHDIAIQSMKNTIAKLRSLGKQVIIVSPVPNTGYNVGQCLERMETGKITLGSNRHCIIEHASAAKAMKDVNRFLTDIEQETGVTVIYLSDYMCREGRCITTAKDGRFLYRDNQHLSIEGSQALAEMIGLYDLILQSDRSRK